LRMAEHTKSFVLYADMIHTFEHLKDAEAGQLIKQIFKYVNDQNPEPPKNKIVLIAFEPIKHQLKRDLKDWDEKRQKRSDAGKQGGINSGKSRRSEANEAMLHFASSNEANEAVNVTVNDNVNVTLSNSARDFLENRNQQYLEYPEDFRAKLSTTYGITGPLIYTTKFAHDKYRDLVDIIHQTITDEKWIAQVTRDHASRNVKNELEKFIKWQLKSQTYMVEKYMTKSEFIKHFVNKHLNK